MELSLETYRLIAKYVESRPDLCNLCRVNKNFQRAAEGALYKTIYASNPWDTFGMCRLFARTLRVAAIVETLTLFVIDEDDSDSGPQSEVSLPNEFWPTVSQALHHTTRLRSLTLRLDKDAAQAWILNGTAFRLRSFHCDLQWDAHLVSFLNTQPDIDDLYIIDYPVSEGIASTSTPVSSFLDPGALPNLSTLQCTFAEAACALVPTRPISRLKTCFSKTRPLEKREELSLLFSKLMETTHHLRSLDIADSSYSESFSMDLLASVVRLQNRVHNLLYLGTLVLPIDGHVVRSSVSRKSLSADILYQAPQVLWTFAYTPFSGVCRGGRFRVGTITTYSGRRAGIGKRAAALLSIPPAGSICQRFREDGHSRIS
ncbi:hypothetical protein J3R83DRAFT_13299 [Lanmaoa asiatica]|nr:hypothetical protein J3R83DRAFT_13299 [Lanmaoa asiatica]